MSEMPSRMPVPQYQLFSPPVAFPLWKLRARQARQYYDWFQSQIPVRLEELRRLVEPYGVPLDYKRETLPALGRWFELQVETRPRTPEEMAAERLKEPAWLEGYVTPWVLTERTFSICIDTGIYFAELLRHFHPALRWDLVLKPKNDVDFHEPVLVGFPNRVRFNPTRILMVLAFKVVDGESMAPEFPRLLRTWEAEATWPVDERSPKKA
jgi:hypothetical protein